MASPQNMRGFSETPIPGLFTDEAPGNPNVKPGPTSTAQTAWRAEGARMGPNAGPQQPGVRQPGSAWADRVRTAANSVSNVNARQNASIRAPIDAAISGVRRLGAGVSDFAGAAGDLGKAVAGNPLTKIGLGAAGLVGAVGDAADTVKAVDAGDTTNAVNSGMRTVAGGVMTVPGVGQALGGAYLGGQLIGSGIDAGLQKFAPGFREKLGSIFASPEERAKMGAAENFAAGGTGAIPATAAGPSPAAPARAPYSDARDGPPVPGSAPTLPPPSSGGVLQYGGDGKPPGYGLTPEQGGGGLVGGGTVSSMQTLGVDGYNRQLANIRALDGGGGGGGGGGGPQVDSSNGGLGTAWKAAIAKREASFERDAMLREATKGLTSGPSDRRLAANITAQIMQGNQREGGDMERARMRESGDMSRAQLGANTTMRGQDQSFALGREAHGIQREGQGVTREGHYLTSATAREQGRRMQQQADRQYNFDTYKFGTEMEGKDADRRVAAGEAMHKEISGMLPPDADGKPDLQNAARYAAGLSAAVGDRQRQLEAEISANPNNTEAKAAHASLMKNGVNTLSPSTKQQLVAGMQLTDVANATATGSMTPWGTRAIQSNAPITKLWKQSNGDYVSDRRGVNGETEVIPGRYIEKEGSTLGFGGRTSNKFASLIQQPKSDPNMR